MAKKMVMDIEYDEFGHLIFEGEYINGLRNGRGKEHNPKINWHVKV